MYKKTKILAVGDIHGDITLVKKLADQAEKENVDLVILCGDLTLAEKSTEQIVGPFINKNKKVLLIPGNHESLATVEFLAELYGATNLHGSHFSKDNVGFFGCSGVNIGIHKIPETEIYYLLYQGFTKISHLPKKVMVTHVHPTGLKMGQLSEFFEGSIGVRAALDKFKPDLVLCSHVHEAEGMEEIIGKTKIINVSRKGKILEL